MNNITAVILAGGKGRRLQGSDKGLILFNRRPMIELVLDIIEPQVSKVIINANRNLDTYESYGYPVIEDALSDFQGPLAGFSIAMQQATTTHILPLPCDGPFISRDYVKRMHEALNKSNAELVVAHDGERMQPVHALLPVNLQVSLDQYLQSGERKIDHWYAQHEYTQVDFSDSPEIFQNINTAEQLNSLEQSRD